MDGDRMIGFTSLSIVLS